MQKVKMEEFKTKLLDLLHKQTNRQVKIPAMGFSDYFVHSVTTEPTDVAVATTTTQAQNNLSEETGNDENAQKSDQEVLESIEQIYFQTDSDPEMYELQKVLSNGVDFQLIENTITQLRKQHKVLTKQVLQNILEQRNACNVQFAAVNEVQKELEESLWTCRKARSYLKYAKTNLTTTSLEILASYRKREILKELLNTLHAIKKVKSTDVEVQQLLATHNYAEAIALLLKCKHSADEYMQYNCVQSLNKKLQETLLMTEFQLDTVLNEMILNFDMQKYAKLQEAYKLLNKSLFAMDQLHINFISAIHSTVNTVLRGYTEAKADDGNFKLLYEQMCDQVPVEKYITCLINLCKTCWRILAAYYQIVVWHQNYKLYAVDLEDSPDIYIAEKLKKGQSRIWNDILNKLCIFLQSSKLRSLKYDQFIQVLSIVQRLKKVGMEFCGEQSTKLIETMQQQSEDFFDRFHMTCLEEVCLFLDNESWTAVDESFTSILQLPEFRTVRHALQRHKSMSVGLMLPGQSVNGSPASAQNCDELVSVQSQDGGSSIYGSYGYFLRFSEKSSPFDGGLDAAMLEEDILSGIVDEASCYFSEESDDEPKSLQSNKCDDDNKNGILMVNNTTLNIFRCIGRYLHMCKLLHGIAPKIVTSMLELLDFYCFVVHEIFGKDASVPLEKFYAGRMESKLQTIEQKIATNIKIWPLNFSSLVNNELANPDTLYGLQHRIVAIESGRSMLQQFQALQNYLYHLLPQKERGILSNYFEYSDFISDLAKPVYTCVTSRVIDLTGILAMMGKLKWDVNNVSFQHNAYIDIMSRSVQNFAMRLEEIVKEIKVPVEEVWNSMAHVSTHLLVEGFSNGKKCSAAGRALMQLDFTNFMSILELISHQKFPEHRAYVDLYIKAYYFALEQFEPWLMEQYQLEQYSTKQLTQLIQCVFSSDKRARQRLIALITDKANTSLNTTS